MSCVRFYKNMTRINEQICEMQLYVNYSIENMESFGGIIENKSYYKKFGNDLYENIEILKPYKFASGQPILAALIKDKIVGIYLVGSSGKINQINGNIDYLNEVDCIYDLTGKYLKNFNTLELLKFCWIQQFQQSAIMLALPREIESDHLLIQHFGDGYLGCVSGSIRKNELLTLALSYDRLIKVEGSRRLFALPKFVVEERLKHSPFSEAEIKELTKVQEMNLKLVDQFIEKKTQEIRKDLDSCPRILRRGIGLASPLN